MLCLRRARKVFLAPEKGPFLDPYKSTRGLWKNLFVRIMIMMPGPFRILIKVPGILLKFSCPDKGARIPVKGPYWLQVRIPFKGPIWFLI